MTHTGTSPKPLDASHGSTDALSGEGVEDLRSTIIATVEESMPDVWLPFPERWRGIKDETPASAVATIAVVPGAALIYGRCATIMAVGLALVILPKLVRELRALLFSGGGSAEKD